MNQGYVHIYTGNGKGKTTAALGLTMRAAGSGMRIFFVQFMKKGDYSEHNSLERLGDRIRVAQFGTGRFVQGNPDEKDLAAAAKGLAAAKEAFSSGQYDLVVLDEAVTATSMNCLTEKALLDLIAQKPPALELVLTGRGAGEKLMAAADLVTEMMERKHYYTKGVGARVGIEK